RGIADHERARKRVAQESRRTLQSALHLRVRPIAAENEVEHFGGAQIARNVDGGDRDIADPRILDPAAQDLGEFALDLLTEPPSARIVAWHVDIRLRRTLERA